MAACLSALLFLASFLCGGEEGARILPLRQRAEVRDAWLEQRLERIAPVLMRREGIDLWVVIAREYNEDPVIKTLLPATWQSARRRTILLLHDPGEGPLERLAVSRYDVGRFFESAWDKEQQPDQWARLAELIAERDPQVIGIDVSRTFALADGLSKSEHDAFFAVLPAEYHERVVSAERLAVGWLETRLPEEIDAYSHVNRIAHEILAEGLSNRVIHPGITRTSDLQWWYRERIAGLKLQTWFHPHVSVQRRETGHSGSFSSSEADRVIRRGDLVHVDLGITYLGLNTDTQQHAYVLRAGEEEAPLGLRRGMETGNALQDLLTDRFATGRTGNEVLALTLAAARRDGIDATIYSHPLGTHGHGAGPTIGLWDQQDGVPGRGDHPLFPDTCYAIELNAAVHVPEWDGQVVRIMLEEDAVFDGERVRYLAGRQTALHLIR